MNKTVEQLLKDMDDKKKERIKEFKDLVKTMLFNLQDKDYEKIRIGTSYYNGKPDYYPNGAPMTYCNVFVYLFAQRLLYVIDSLLGIDGRVNRPSPYYTPISLFLNKCENQDISGRIVEEVNFLYAQEFASRGGLVIALAPEKYNKTGQLLDAGHMALVYPQDTIENDENNIMIAGAGSRAVWGLKSNYDAFIKYGYHVRYFHILESQKKGE